MVSALSAFPRRKHALIFSMALHWNLPSMSISCSERPDLCPAFQVWPHPFSLKRKGCLDLPNAAQDTTSPLCGTGTLLTHVQPDVHQDSQVLYNKAASSKLIRTSAWDLQNCCQEGLTGETELQLFTWWEQKSSQFSSKREKKHLNYFTGYFMIMVRWWLCVKMNAYS